MQAQHRQIDRPNGEPAPLTLVVEGMSCAHCKLVITGEVSRVSGVDCVEVDLDRKRVLVRGADVGAGGVFSAIDAVGEQVAA